MSDHTHERWSDAQHERAARGDVLAVHVETHGEPVAVGRVDAWYGEETAPRRATRYVFACGAVVNVPDAPSEVRA